MMKRIVKAYVLTSLINIVVHASDNDSQSLLKQGRGSHYSATNVTSDVAGLESGTRTNQISPFQLMFQELDDPHLAQMAIGLYGHANPTEKAELDDLFKDRQPASLAMRSKRKGSSHAKQQSENLTPEDLAAETARKLMRLVSRYVEKEYTKPKRLLGQQYESEKGRNCCTMITSAFFVIGTNVANFLLTSYMTQDRAKKCH